MVKTIYKFTKTNGESLFQIKMSDNRIKQIEEKGLLEINKKQKIIKGELFDQMFPTSTQVQNLHIAHYTCGVCGRIESFFVKNKMIYCLNCYEMFGVNQKSNESINIEPFVIQPFIIERKVSTKEKKPFTKPSTITENIDEIMNQSSTQNHHSTLLRFNKRLEVVESKNKTVAVVVQENHDTSINSLKNILNKMDYFEQQLNIIMKKNYYNILYAHHLLKTVDEYLFNNILSPKIIENRVTNNDIIYKLVLENCLKNTSVNKKIYGTFHKTLTEKVLTDNLGNKPSDISLYLRKVFQHDHNCNICGCEVIGKKFVNLIQGKELTSSINEVIQVCSDCALSVNKLNVLEVIAERIINNSYIDLSVPTKIHAITQYNYILKKYNSFSKKENFINLQQEFILYYNLFLSRIFKDLGISKKIETNIYNIDSIKEILNQIISSF